MEKHILLIDDDADEPDIFANALRDAGFEFRFTWANGADEGLSHLDKITPHLIVLDFNMPKTNGLELLIILKGSASFAHIPVVMYSATMDTILTGKAMASGAAACIRKPFDMQELPALLKPYF